MNIFKTNHRGYEIEYCEETELWQVGRYGATDFAAPSLKKLKAILDKEIASNKNMPDMEAWREVWGDKNSFEKVTITSVDEKGAACWVRDSKGRRSKTTCNCLFAVSKENEDDMALIEELVRQRKTITQQIDEIHERLRFVTVR